MRTAMWSMAPRCGRPGSRQSRVIGKNGMTLSPLGETTTARQSIPSALRTRSRGLYRRTPSWSATSACTTIGCCNSATRAGRILSSAPWASGRWGLASQAFWGRNSLRLTGLVCRCAAMGLSSCMRACSALPWNTVCRWCGWCGITLPMPRSAACSAATSAGGACHGVSTPRHRSALQSGFCRHGAIAGIDGVNVDRASDLSEALRAAIVARRPTLINASIGADTNPGGAGVWELPGLGRSEPAFGGRHQPEKPS